MAFYTFIATKAPWAWTKVEINLRITKSSRKKGTMRVRYNTFVTSWTFFYRGECFLFLSYCLSFYSVYFWQVKRFVLTLLALNFKANEYE